MALFCSNLLSSPLHTPLFYSPHILYQTMSSFVSQVMQPGGGVMLLPVVRVVIACLLVLTLAAMLVGVARIHMAVLSLLSAGLLFSLSFFEAEFKKVQRNNSSATATTTTTTRAKGKPAKTD